jgi:uncharacterized protein
MSKSKQFHMRQISSPENWHHTRLINGESGLRVWCELGYRAAPICRGDFGFQTKKTQEDADPGELHFTYTFPSRSYLLGSSLATLFVSTAATDDLDVFVQLRKADQTGKILQSYNVPLADLARMGMSEHEIPVINPLIYLGPTGHLRASHRALDPLLSKPHWPIHAHTAEEKIPPGQVTKLDIGVWPGGMVFSPGEQLVVKVSGHWMTLAEYPHLRGEAKDQQGRV